MPLLQQANSNFLKPPTDADWGAADYADFARVLREIDQRDDVIVTIWQATGKWFCAGTDVKRAGSRRVEEDGGGDGITESFVNGVARTSTNVGQALYSHRKILVAALNGPVLPQADPNIALLGYFDFIYCMPNAWLSTPFPFIGIIAEGGSSVSFVNRMGLAKANEALIWGKKKDAQELLNCGFIQVPSPLAQILPQQSAESFHEAVRAIVLEDMRGLDPTAILVVKRLIRAGLNEKNDPDAVNLRESYAQAERFASGVPLERFAMLARKEIKHKAMKLSMICIT
ncbi:ClpP/crotonase [Mycena rebaudengoi]|nr:ClpP/crotonase [Mycena rebaudengoi]